jgi:flagellar basal-body rod protein FlgF
MGDGIYTALTGAVAQQQTLDVIANNVANANTAGFRADRAAFAEFLAGAQKNNTPSVNEGSQARPDHFVQIESITHDQQDGTLRLTGNQLDFGLSGPGFFVVRTPQGDRLTRAGSFMLRADGTLSTHDGHDVLGEDGHAIHLHGTAAQIQVGMDGGIQVDGQHVNKFKLVRVADATKLEKESAVHFVPAEDAEVVDAKDVQVTQGHLESSNVNAVAGLNELITVNRSFDALQRVIETFQKLDERTARELGSRNG